MSTNTKLARLKQQRDELKKNVQALLQRGKIMQAQTAMAKVQKLGEAIEEAEAAVPRALSELFDKKTLNKSGLNVAMVKTYLAADFLADCAYDLKDIFNKLGVVETHLIPILEDIKKKSQAYASLVCHPEFAGLSDFIVTNEKFLESMHEITKKYIDDHLTITDDED